ncbi:MAG: hypothetical protein H7647_10065, partial [Candidatus Heimdallarchaeota archaeon]|nr:hypothetical protein [Candidatus Heimdallarchaeota archaeon]MCK4254771.1 hypothetical protein [Candidatus Heimdallarchaeota archaeon]
MKFREEALQSFIEKLLLVAPDTISVYSFTRDISQFDNLLKDKNGLVIILEGRDFSAQNFILIDLIYDSIQDEFGWEGGLELATSFSRNYVRTKANLWHINVQNPQCLLPEDQLNLRETGVLVYGKDIIEDMSFPHNKEEILKISIGLTRKEAKDIANRYKKYQPLIDPECCWQRHNFTINHSIVGILRGEFEKVVNGIQPEKFAHIYGRYGGSGKTQIIYSLMKLCKELKLPFIYRSEFWKDKNGLYKEIETNPENVGEEVADWLIKNISTPKVVIFLDEVDVELSLLEKKMEEKFTEARISFLIISGGKDIPSFTKNRFDLFDISKEYPFSGDQYYELIENLLHLSNIDEGLFPRNLIKTLVEKTRLWNLHIARRTPTSVILSASLSFIEAIKIAEKRKKPIKVTRELIEKWSLLST